MSGYFRSVGVGLFPILSFLSDYFRYTNVGRFPVLNVGPSNVIRQNACPRIVSEFSTTACTICNAFRWFLAEPCHSGWFNSFCKTRVKKTACKIFFGDFIFSALLNNSYWDFPGLKTHFLNSCFKFSSSTPLIVDCFTINTDLIVVCYFSPDIKPT